jgi:hypothetical protein
MLIRPKWLTGGGFAAKYMGGGRSGAVEPGALSAPAGYVALPPAPPTSPQITLQPSVASREPHAATREP